MIELILVMAIIATLLSLLLPAVQRAREASRRTQCIFNVRQLVIASLDYHLAHRVLPSGWIESSPEPGLPIHILPNTGFSWGSALLPEFDRMPLYNQIDFQAPILGEPDRDSSGPGIQNNETVVAAQPISLFRCPSSTAPETSQNMHPNGQLLIPKQATSSYLGCYGTGVVNDGESRPDSGTGAFFRNSIISLNRFVDGTAYTILYGERRWHGATPAGVPKPGDAYWAGTPDSWLSDVLSTTGVSMNSGQEAEFSSEHPGGCVFGFADARVIFLNENVESFPGEESGPHMGLYQKLGHLQDQQPIGEF